MKRLSYLPLLCAFIAGCSTPAVQNEANANAAETTTDTATNAAPAEAATTAPAAEPTKTYIVKDSSNVFLNENTPPEELEAYRAALKKVSLPPPPLDTKLADKIKVVMDTSRGPITLELNTKAAPLQVRSFVYLAGKGFFDSTTFHRFADLTGQGGNIIQGGDPLTRVPKMAGYAGTGGPGYEIPGEFNDLKHDKLVIAAARSRDRDSAGSQFYITQAPVPFLDGRKGFPEEGYTVFGKVVEGAKAAIALRQNDSIKTVKVVK